MRLSFVGGSIFGAATGVALTVVATWLLFPTSVPHRHDTDHDLSAQREGRWLSKYPEANPFAAVHVYKYEWAYSDVGTRSTEILNAALSRQRTFSQSNQDAIVLKLFDLLDQEKHIGSGSQVVLPTSQKSMVTEIVDIAYKTHNNTFGNGDVRRRFFVDLAANDAVGLSNSLLLEASGWDGLCIEANPIYWYGLARWRSCTVVGAVVGEERRTVVMHMAGSRGKIKKPSGTQKDNSFSSLLDGSSEEQDQVRQSVSVDTLFRRFNVPRVIDYFSLDVEGAEEIVMNGFPFEEYKVLVFTIERPSSSLTELLVKKGYIPIAVLSTYGETLWMHQSVPLDVDIVRTAVFKLSKKAVRSAVWKGSKAFLRQQKFWKDHHPTEDA